MTKSLLAQGVAALTLMALMFVSQALQSNIDRARFHPSMFRRRCWEEVVDRYYAIPRRVYACGSSAFFQIGKVDNPVAKLYWKEIEAY